MIEILRKYEPSPLDWVEVQFGDENGEDKVVRTGNTASPSDISVTVGKD